MTATDIEIQAHPLLAQLIGRHQARWVDFDKLTDWQQQAGDQVLLLAGDPVRFPEALDVAVVLPELQRVSAVQGRPFGLGVVVPDCAQALARTFGSQHWPTLVFFRDGQYVTAVSGMHDWPQYLALVAQALDAPPSRAPGIGIPVVSANNDSGNGACH